MAVDHKEQREPKETLALLAFLAEMVTMEILVYQVNLVFLAPLEFARVVGKAQ